MSPSPSRTNVVDSGRRYAIAFCQIAFALIAVTYFAHLGFIELGGAGGLSAAMGAMANSILGVFYLGAPLQIFEVVAAVIAIQMTALHAIRTRANERQKNKPVNLMLLGFPIFAQCYAQALSMIVVMLRDMAQWSSFASINSAFKQRRKASNLSKIADLVKSNVARNVAPFLFVFRHRISFRFGKFTEV